jgi:hypothetical protein
MYDGDGDDDDGGCPPWVAEAPRETLEQQAGLSLCGRQ